MISRNIYMQRLLAYKDTELVKVITGIRRCGKSMLLQLFKEYLLKNGVSDNNIISINFELMEFDEIRTYNELYKFIKQKLPKEGKCYILLDEIQQVKQFEKTIISLNKEADVDIYITGSNAYLLSSEISTLLSGRYVEIKMLPLSFKEYLDFSSSPDNISIDKKFIQYIKYGGFPLITSLHQDNMTINEYLLGIYNTVIVKDIVSRNNIKDINLLERIVKYVINNTGNIISPNKICGYLNSQNKGSRIKSETVANYIDMLEKAFIVYQVRRQDIRGKEMLKTLSKYYVSDTGIRNMIAGYSDSDIGHNLEAIVYFELLRRGYAVYVGKVDTLEIDFYAVKTDEKKYFQVAYSIMSDDVRDRELAPLLAVSDNYEKCILSLDSSYVTDYKGIKFVNIIDFLLE